MLHSLFASLTVIQKVDAEGNKIDQKTQLCPMFKAGMCEKGKRCKMSHTLTATEAKTADIDIYSDPRQKKVGMMPDTIITCKHFLEAVEKELYGFNWVCPNKGEKCEYRHMLPPGYVLNRDKGEEGKEEEGALTLEERIEEERAALQSDNLTPVTPESFAAWKERRAAKRQAELEAKIKAEESKGRKDKGQMAFMSGKALFTYDPSLFKDDEDAADEYSEEDEEGQNQKPAEEESKQEVSEEAGLAEKAIDKDLFAGEGAEDEEIDFD